MTTDRDLEIISFLENFKVASTETLRTVFFNSNTACSYKRLHALVEDGKVKRIRDGINSQYTYYVKRPALFVHSLLVTDFYRELYKQTEITTFAIEPPMGSIRPDAVFISNRNGRKIVGILEVEISHKGFNRDKYIKFCKSNEYKSFFTRMPPVYVITNSKKPLIHEDVDFIRVPLSMGNLTF